MNMSKSLPPRDRLFFYEFMPIETLDSFDSKQASYAASASSCVQERN